MILNSSLTVFITLQNWTADNHGILFQTLIKKGFTVPTPTAVQQMQGQIIPVARKGTTTALTVDHANRKIILQITNEINTPNKNIEEVFDVLSEIGFPVQESIARVDIQGNITIKIQEAQASTLVPKIIKPEFAKTLDKIFDRSTKVIGIRVASQESFTSGVSKSPFVILIEPLFTDDSDSKFISVVTYSTSSAESAREFTASMYERLKETITNLE